MKKKYLFGILTLAMCTTLVFSASAQEKQKTGVGKAIDKTGKAIGHAATDVGHKTAEVAVKGSSKVADKVYKGKMAPDGTDVYIDSKNRKYYVNKKGGRVYLKASQIRNRPEHKM
ncbi:MAG: hypothetical protein P0Y49_01940 [Candidatus Pedobacter colombiensis]|uniref:PBCV-specific basic adaptor domain-containing protein n=1 Tax=Candidatus Pedobacter colombiensis TaxID=3121371 RepID=A0AAJ5W8K2_9SPHI|nr:hypothetical protein [Pedobacter sp.]WEK19914.1 MAG: hypothetical protein P0Y49_01940 [Pedobacter sp.]